LTSSTLKWILAPAVTASQADGTNHRRLEEFRWTFMPSSTIRSGIRASWAVGPRAHFGAWSHRSSHQESFRRPAPGWDGWGEGDPIFGNASKSRMTPERKLPSRESKHFTFRQRHRFPRSKEEHGEAPISNKQRRRGAAANIATSDGELRVLPAA